MQLGQCVLHCCIIGGLQSSVCVWPLAKHPATAAIVVFPSQVSNFLGACEQAATSLGHDAAPLHRFEAARGSPLELQKAAKVARNLQKAGLPAQKVSTRCRKPCSTAAHTVVACSR